MFQVLCLGIWAYLFFGALNNTLLGKDTIHAEAGKSYTAIGSHSSYVLKVSSMSEQELKDGPCSH